MTRAAAALAAGALFAAGTAVAADTGISLTARAGGSYLLTTTAHDGLTENGSLFGLSANLGVAGGYFNPRFLRWNLSGDYDWSRGVLFNVSNAANRFGFRAAVQLLGGTPVPVSVLASRIYTDALTQLEAGPSLGTSVTTTYAGTVALRQEQLPNAFLSLSRQDTSSERLGEGSTFARSTRLGLGVSQSLTKFDYTVNYDTSWNTGTYADFNYQGHSVGANVTAPLSPTVRLNLYDNYFLRLPTSEASTNPRYDSNALGAGLQWHRDRRLTSWFGYTYNHDLVEVPAAPVSERSTHALTASTRWLMVDTVYLLGTLRANAAQARLGEERVAGLGQTAGLGAEWQGTYPWGTALATATFTGGAVEPEGGSPRFVWGVAGAGSYARTWSRWTASGQYLASYDTGTSIVFGRALTQQLRAEAIYRPTEDSRLRGLFAAGAGRREDALQGVLLNRSLSLLLEYSSRSYSTQLGGGLSDGLADALTNPVSDGLFLPAAFNTHSAYAMLGGSAAFDRGRLTLSMNARLGSISAPGRPTVMEEGFQLLVAYTLGKFRLSAEERFAVGGLDNARQQTNVFMLRLSRSFDWQVPR